MSIQLVSRARQAGLVITPRAVFQHQTVAALAAAAGMAEERSSSLPDIAAGALPPTPIMHWLIERGGPIEPFNQAMLLQVPAGLQELDLVAALQAVLDHHDALRLRLVASARDKDFSVEVLPAGAVEAKGFFRRIDIGGLHECDGRACIAQEAQAAPGRLAPERLGWCRRFGLMLVRARPDGCCSPSITLPLTECLGASCCLILWRHGLRLRADGPLRSPRGAPRFGIGRIGWRRKRKAHPALASFPSGVGYCESLRSPWLPVRLTGSATPMAARASLR